MPRQSKEKKVINGVGTGRRPAPARGGDAYSAPAVYVKEAGLWKMYYICRDYLGSITHIANADGTLKAEYSYDAWGRLRNPDTQVAYAPGMEPVLFLGRGYTGHEHLTWFGLINMNARLYDPALGRFLSPDPYVQMPDFTQNFNRYSYCLNNPLRYVDKNGELFWLIPIAVGALIGAYSGYKIGKANAATGWNMIGYIAGGAAIGGLAGGAALGVSAIGGAAWWAGAAAGAVSGAGFNGLATNWNGAAMLKGACIGALAGFVGGGVSSAIGGGWGAVAGGSTSSGVSTSLSGGDIGQIGVSMLIGGAMAYGTYELTSYMSYKDADLPHTNYKQFKTMQADYQRSRFWRKEYGGILTKDGNVVRAPAAYREKYGVNFDQAWTGKVSPDNIQTHYHTHWAANDMFLGYNSSGQEVRTANGPSQTDLSFVENTSNLVSTGILIDRGSLYFYNMHGTGADWGSTFLRYFPFYWLW